jgi:membrane-bound lytic murein transglycosylase D
VGKKGIRPGKKLVVYVRENAKKPKELDVKVEGKPDSNIAVKKDTDKKLVAENKSTEKTSYLVHKVKSGESLYSISKKYGVNANDLSTLNNLKTKNLNIGQLLKIKPKGE